MSRIEDALENANRKRNAPQEEAAPPPEKPAPGPVEDERVEGVEPNNPYLVMLKSDPTPVHEEYKKLKSMVVKLTRKDKFRNTIMVTSSVRAEGKSVTAINLAISLAQDYDNTVLLVDADFRKPSIHEYLGISPRSGLTSVLMNGGDISGCLIKTGIGKLSVLPAGKATRNPVEMIMSEKMKNLVTELRQRYADRYVIFDTPPVLPFAEVHSLASLVDGVIFVVREGHAPMSNIKGALEMLKDAPILGTVYNCASFDRFSGSQYYYYGYNKYYKTEEKKSRQ